MVQEIFSQDSPYFSGLYFYRFLSLTHDLAIPTTSAWIRTLSALIFPSSPPRKLSFSGKVPQAEHVFSHRSQALLPKPLQVGMTSLQEELRPLPCADEQSTGTN